jgi:hypothetical protein
MATSALEEVAHHVRAHLGHQVSGLSGSKEGR